ncbi:MAG: sulfotransferase family 2 domain-containing protein [Alphaproteobacteria bacterium]|nr:sulfotransferase family 2 domain-containing protein [Alphaproteobacteria bacterium]
MARGFLGRMGLGDAPRKIVFLHIPKSAGTTAKDYLTACIGSRKRGQTVLLSECFPDDLVSEDEVRLARTARFVSGHFSWDAMQKIEPDAAVTFTTLCDPAERLWSLYFNLRMTASKNRRKGMAEVYKWACDLDPSAFYTIDDRRIRHLANNVMVRQLAGEFDQMPSSDQEWQALLDKAKLNLKALSCVCFKTTFDQDFVKVLKLANYPVIETIGRRNVTADPQLDPSRKSEMRTRFISQSWDTIESFVRWDRELYDFALDLRLSGKL